MTKSKMSVLNWILFVAVCLLNEVIPVTASYCYYRSYYSRYYCYSGSSYITAGAIPGIVVGCIIFGVIVFVVVVIVCKKTKTSGNRGTVVRPTATITTVHAPPPGPSFPNQPAGMSYPPPPGQNMAYPPPQGQFGYPQPPPPQGQFGYSQPPPPPAYGGYGAPPPKY
ncbi:protein shisa-5-like [Mytilus californianus]|uniref:protein shisa-5-like n=1 Tax=Mytilus californianus TaxID=6549 RepID=UPI0022476D97|nr:protein shisa-5-like [Mytilus californianus]